MTPGVVVHGSGQATTSQDDERDLPWRAIDSQTPVGTTETRYDPNGNLVYVPSPAGHITSHTYDDSDRGRRKTWTGGAFEEASYDKCSNVTSLLTANGSTITYVHDGRDGVTSVVRSSGTDTFVYDLVGRVREAANAEAVVTYQYDGAGRVTHETTTFPGSSQGHTVQYRYDAASRVDRITYPDGSSTDVTVDTLDRVTTLVGERSMTGAWAEYRRDLQ